jgi:hypothetical protein
MARTVLAVAQHPPNYRSLQIDNIISVYERDKKE